MTQKELIYVKTVAQEKSLSKASQRLFITQPSLSNAIRKIEDKLGLPLFTRTNKGLFLTFAGEKYCQMANDVLQIFNDFELEIYDISNLKKGRLTVGVTVYLAAVLMPRLLKEFQTIAPNIDFNFVEMTSKELETQLRIGAIDFALLHAIPVDNTQENKGVRYTKVVENRFLTVLSHDHPAIKHAYTFKDEERPYLPLSNLSDEVFILGRKTQRSRYISDTILSRAEITPKKIISTRNFATAKEFAALGLGVAILPEFYTSTFASREDCIFFNIEDNLSPFWNICIAKHVSSYISQAGRLFLSLIGQAFERNDLADEVIDDN